MSLEWPADAELVQRFKDAVRGLPFADSETAQISKGPSERKSWRSLGTDVVLYRGLVVSKVTTSIVLEDDWVALTLPLTWKGDYRFNGRVVDRDDLLLTVSGDGYTQTFEQRDAISVGLRQSRLRAACAAIAGKDPTEIRLRDLAVNLGSGRAAALKKLAVKAMKRSFVKAPGAADHAIAPGDESAVLTACLPSLLPSLLKDDASKDASTTALAVFLAARDALSDTKGRVSIGELCTAANVSEAWLYRCFVTICGVSPAHFSKCRRLSAARERLLDASAPPRSVKDVALSLGFMESGRFAADYRAIFGESPSETLEHCKHGGPRPAGEATRAA